MFDFFSLFKTIFIFLLVFGFELFGLLQGITYYKIGKALYGTKEIYGIESNDFPFALIGFVLGSILFLVVNISAFQVGLALGLVISSLHILAVYLILRWYLKRLEATQKEDVQSK